MVGTPAWPLGDLCFIRYPSSHLPRNRQVVRRKSFYVSPAVQIMVAFYASTWL
jgi:hypothetical protein